MTVNPVSQYEVERKQIHPENIREFMRLQARGWSYHRIADHTGFDVNAIITATTKMNNRALQNLVKLRTAEYRKQYMRLEHVIDELFQAWERSKGNWVMEETTEEANPQATPTTLSPGSASGFQQITPPATVPVRVKRQVKQQCGDVAYIEQARHTMTDIRKMLKLEDSRPYIDIHFGNGQTVLTNQQSAREQAEMELHEWQLKQKERLERMLETPIPDPNDIPDDLCSHQPNEPNGNPSEPSPSEMPPKDCNGPKSPTNGSGNGTSSLT